MPDKLGADCEHDPTEKRPERQRVEHIVSAVGICESSRCHVERLYANQLKREVVDSGAVRPREQAEDRQRPAPAPQPGRLLPIMTASVITAGHSITFPAANSAYDAPISRGCV